MNLEEYITNKINEDCSINKKHYEMKKYDDYKHLEHNMLRNMLPDYIIKASEGYLSYNNKKERIPAIDDRFTARYNPYQDPEADERWREKEIAAAQVRAELARKDKEERERIAAEKEVEEQARMAMLLDIFGV